MCGIKHWFNACLGMGRSYTVCGVLFGLLFMFFKFYLLDLHNKMCCIGKSIMKHQQVSY